MMLTHNVCSTPRREFHVYRNKKWTKTHTPSTFIHINKYQVMSTYSGVNKSTGKRMSTDSGDKKTSESTTKPRPDLDLLKLKTDLPIHLAMLYYTDELDPEQYRLIYRNKNSRFLTHIVLGPWFGFLSFYAVQGLYFWWPYMGKMVSVNDDKVVPILTVSASLITMSMCWKLYVWQCLRIYKAIGPEKTKQGDEYIMVIPKHLGHKMKKVGFSLQDIKVYSKHSSQITVKGRYYNCKPNGFDTPEEYNILMGNSNQEWDKPSDTKNEQK